MWSFLCIPPLAAMIITDLRSRRIGTLHLIIFGITLLVASILEIGWLQVLVNLSCNWLTIFILWLSLYGYSRLRNMTLSEMIGSGDLWFALAVTPYWEVREYVIFLMISCSMTLVAWWLSGLWGRRERDIPLVTGMGACFGVMILYRTLIVLI